MDAMDAIYEITDYYPNQPKIRSPLGTLWLDLRLKENVSKGAVPILGAVTPYPAWARFSLEQIVETIESAKNNIIETRLEPLYVHTFSYFMILKALFEHVARATNHFYPGLNSQLSPSFSKQLKYFEGNETIDTLYVDYVREFLKWYPHFKALRDKLCHPHIKMEYKFDLDSDLLIDALTDKSCPEFENESFVNYLKLTYKRTYHFYTSTRTISWKNAG